MRSCRDCRHSFSVDHATVERELTVGHMGSDPLTLLEHPMLRRARHDGWRVCRARQSLVTPATAASCAHYGSKIAGLFIRRSTDEQLYADREAERAAARSREIAEAARVTAEAEATVRTRPCEACARVHDRCVDCDMPWAFCGACSSCGGGTRWYRATGRWECSLCEKPAPAPVEQPRWDLSRCDGCRATHLRKGSEDGQ